MQGASGACREAPLTLSRSAFPGKLAQFTRVVAQAIHGMYTLLARQCLVQVGQQCVVALVVGVEVTLIVGIPASLGMQEEVRDLLREIRVAPILVDQLAEGRPRAAIHFDGRTGLVDVTRQVPGDERTLRTSEPPRPVL